MRPPTIYKHERDAGLAELVRSNRLSLAGLPSIEGEPRLVDRAKAADTDFDLYPVRAVLVTTGWNLNDDVFDRIEVWSARKTPEHKQANRLHDCDKIVGHITSNVAVASLPDGGVGELVPDDSDGDALPEQFHLVTDAVVYRHWSKSELQEEVDALLDSIRAGKMAVSMECLFSAFDYALKGADGSERVVARNSQTAFLTKHLRAYGGTGRYGEFRVGRLLRNFVFSGVGFVENPANPHSVILAAGSANLPERFSVDAVYAALPQGENDMTELETAKSEMAKVQARADLLATDNDALKAKLAEAEALLKDAKLALDKSAADLKALEKDLLEKLSQAAEAHKAEVAKLTESLAVSKAEFEKLALEKQTLDRIAKAKEKIPFSSDAAAKFVASTIKLNEAEFDAQIELFAALKPTPAAEVKPKPSAGVGQEELEPNEAAAKASATPAKVEPDVTTPASAGVSAVATDILSYFGVEAE